MQYRIYILGMLAAALTSLSYLPQLQKAMPRNSTSDLSLKMLVVLSAGVCLWIVYGVLKDDWVIILANSIGASLSLAVLGFKGCQTAKCRDASKTAMPKRTSRDIAPATLR